MVEYFSSRSYSSLPCPKKDLYPIARLINTHFVLFANQNLAPIYEYRALMVELTQNTKIKLGVPLRFLAWSCMLYKKVTFCHRKNETDTTWLFIDCRCTGAESKKLTVKLPAIFV